MIDYWERGARYRAYRWYRSNHPDASHQEAWTYAAAHWEEYLSLPREELDRLRSPSPALLEANA